MYKTDQEIIKHASLFKLYFLLPQQIIPLVRLAVTENKIVQMKSHIILITQSRLFKLYFLPPQTVHGTPVQRLRCLGQRD